MKKLLLLLLLSLPAAAAPALPTDTLLLRQFLAAAADTSIYDSVLVARFMCSDFLFRRHEPHVDTVVALLRESLYFLRAGLLRNQPSVRRSKFVTFRELPHKPFTLVDGEEGAYVLLDGEQPLMCLLVRNKRIAAFSISFYAGPGKGHFREGLLPLKRPRSTDQPDAGKPGSGSVVSIKYRVQPIFFAQTPASSSTHLVRPASMHKQLTLLFLYLGVALLLGSCRRAGDDPEPTGKLLGTRWMLVQLDAFPIMASSYYEDNQSYIQFSTSGQRTTGLAACDAISGQFTLSANTSQLTISQLSLTKGSCTSPVVGPRYLATLPQTSRYKISGDTLRLYDAQAAQPRLIFRAAP